MARASIMKQILESTRYIWDRSTTRPEVRDSFLKIISCGTWILGCEVYESATERKVVFYTCKSRFCPSCGHRATLQWIQEQEADLPDIAYCAIVFTLPGTLWGIFKRDRHLMHDLPVLGAGVIKDWVKIHYNITVATLVVLHTFGGDLQFNTHLHILVSAEGIDETTGRFVTSIIFDKSQLEKMWRESITMHLNAAIRAGILRSTETKHLCRTIKNVAFMTWHIFVDASASKSHFIRYAFRYVRRPPVALRHLLSVSDREVQFNAKDTRGRRRVATTLSLWQFVELLSHHVPDRYRHAIRRFGLLAPRAKNLAQAALLLVLGQTPRRRPSRLKWRESILRSAGTDPLLDSRGQLLRFVGQAWHPTD
jgi:hypothetical protein